MCVWGGGGGGVVDGSNTAREDSTCQALGVVEDKLHFVNDRARYDLKKKKASR